MHNTSNILREDCLQSARSGKNYDIYICSIHSHRAHTHTQYSLIFKFCNKGKAF